MTPHIRPGQQSDVVACVDILRDWADETLWMAELDDLQPMQAFWRDLFETDLVWVAEMGDRIVGFCTRDDDNIGALYVVAEARRTGIGKRLLDMAKADRDWITVWVYEKNIHALRFYKREGLLEVSREIEHESNLMNIEHRWTNPN
ncbi:GNAT family N-acetyltransferase [Denitrobaculum tricleocarpae]|uniref:GNAT family N-acetyltransferase n=2 Tax=Denitrobaculum tricleocarpae TaxID=2591009 RepID=A0A545SY11_9PROT|nr:GNAT family N-acetyltransferase [Denitrobaculum tricleocarpae]